MLTNNFKNIAKYKINQFLQPALARGSGIKIVNQWRRVPRDQELVAQM
jgi:hypothetical protein